MMRWAMVLGLLGLAVATGLIIWSGWDAVLQALAEAGFIGILAASLFHLVPMAIASYGWLALIPGRNRPSFGFFFYVMWLRVCINNLLPVARIGGEVVAVRLMLKHGMRKGPAIGSTVVETTLSIIGQLLFTIMGVTLFFMHFSNQNLFVQMLAGVLVTVGLVAALLMIQKIGVFTLLTKIFNLLFRDKWQQFMGKTELLDRAVQTMYRRHQGVVICAVTQFLGWLLGSVEIWIALHFIGHPLSLAQCIMMEAAIQAVSSAAFLIPGSLGIQEATFLIFGQMLGLTPEHAAALAIIRRCRDLILYVPGLIVWQIQEGRWLINRRQQIH